MSEEKNFKVGQLWLTRDGQEFTIFKVQSTWSSSYPIHAGINARDTYSFTSQGNLYRGEESGEDLVTLVKDVHEETPESEALTKTFEMKTTQRDSITVDIHFESGNEYTCIKHNENGKPYEIKLRKNGEHGGYEITFDSLEEMKVIANAMLKMCDQS
jgi:hypothetical protein